MVGEALWEEEFNVISQLLKLILEDKYVFLVASSDRTQFGLSPTTKLNREVGEELIIW